MIRKFIWAGIVLGLVPLCMGSACGGYAGWPGLDTSGVDAKVTTEVSVFGVTALQSGLWTFYVNYNNNSGAQSMKAASTYRDGTAPFGVFTSDGLLEEHFHDHVGVITSNINDRNKDGIICWIGCPFEAGDYTIPDGFCPDVGGTGSTASSKGFQAYCDKGDWVVLVANLFFEETKASLSGSKFSNTKGGPGGFNPISVAQILASSQLIPNSNGGLVVTINALSLPSGASHTLTTPITANVYGFGHALAIDATQAGLKEAAGWLASQFAGQADSGVSVSLTFNGGAATGSVTIAGGNSASIPLQHYAGS